MVSASMTPCTWSTPRRLAALTFGAQAADVAPIPAIRHDRNSETAQRITLGNRAESHSS